jgi:DNA-binding SARP family transcriptional activator
MVSGSPSNGGEPLLLRLAGSFAVARGGRELATQEVGSRKARTLLALLAVERGRRVPTGRIVEILWGDEPPRQPAENVATLVSRIRAALGVAAVVGGRDGYRLGDPPEIEVDLDQAGRLVQEAEARLAAGEPALAGVAARRAGELLAATTVLDDTPYADWAEPARVEVAGLLRRARHAAAAAALGAAEPAAALTAVETAIAADPLDEAAYRLLMLAHQAAGEPARALTAYDRLRELLADELGTDPAPQTRDVHLAVLRNQAPAVEPVPQQQRPTELELVGRDAEVAAVTAAWSRAAGGRPATLLLTGEAGIGKTRLAAEVVRLATATGAIVLEARCYETERSLFLQPVVEALTPLATGLSAVTLRQAAGDRADALATLVPEVATVLGAAAPGHGTAEIERRRAYDAVAVFLRRLSAGRPVLLFLDDLHHGGVATIELLHYLSRHVGGGRLLILGTVRGEEGEELLDRLAGVADRLDLGPLGTDAVDRLAERAGQGSLAAAIGRRTRGHTLFVVETLRGLAAGDAGVPGSLREAVLSRIRRAGPEADELLRAAAVLGSSFDPDGVAGLLDLSPGAAARRCAQLLPSRLIVVAGRAYEFGNDLIQEVLYATTPAPTRLAYHRRAADLFVNAPERMAAHAGAAEDWPRAARGWLLAGEQAVRRYAAGDADRLLGRALAAARAGADDEVAGRIHLARGRVRDTLGRHLEAVADHEQAVALARVTGDRRLKMLALREWGGTAWVGSGRPISGATPYLREALRLAEILGDRAMEASVLGWLAVLGVNRLQFDTAVTHGQRAIAAARAAGDDEALAAALDGVKTAHAYLGELALLEPPLAELQRLAHRLGNLWQLQWCVFESSFPLLAAGEWGAAEVRIEEALAVNRRSGYAGYESWFICHLGWIARIQGRYDDALAHGRRAVAQATNGWWNAATAAILGTTLLELGERAEAGAVLKVGLGFTADGATPYRPEAYRLRCLAPLAEATGSATLLDEADGMIRAITAPAGAAWVYGADAYLAVGRAWLARDEPDRAAEIVAPLLAAAARTGWVGPEAEASLVAARCAHASHDHDGADLLLARARELGERHGMPRVVHDAGPLRTARPAERLP